MSVGLLERSPRVPRDVKWGDSSQSDVVLGNTDPPCLTPLSIVSSHKGKFINGFAARGQNLKCHWEETLAVSSKTLRPCPNKND